MLPAVDADAGAAPRGSSNIRHLSRMELSGGGQIVIQGTTAFVGHQHGPEGTTILDISDPRKPKIAVADHVPASVVAYPQGAGASATSWW